MTNAVDASEPLNPLRNREFRKLFSAQVIALVGTGLSTVALTLLAYDLVGGNAAAVLGTALAFKMIAYVVFAPIVGGLAHRFSRKPFLIGMDIVRAAIVLAMPFVTQVWQIYLLIFVLNLFSAGFKPVFAATIPDILPEERAYTRALSMSRLAYDLENLLSPTFAALALLFMTYTGLFIANSVAFLISAVLIVVTAVPASQQVSRLGNLWSEISFGTVSYFNTPRLRALCALYLGVSAASAMIIVNTVIYVKENLALTSTDVAAALAAAGGGSMIAALTLPKVLDKVADRPVMLMGGAVMAVGVFLISSGPQFPQMLGVWFLIGLGWSLVQTPAGRVVNRSSSAADRSAFFSAQFAISHACWLLFYPIAGQLTVLAARLWPRDDAVVLVHEHQSVEHSHEHSHDEHHDHEGNHAGLNADEPHTHVHAHAAVRHSHAYVIDDHHASWPASSTP
jgi:MFS family permease